MIEVDLSKTDKEIVAFVTAKCKPFGIIVSVNLYRIPRPIAIVRMEDRRQAAKVALKFGKSGHDGTAIIPLRQRRTALEY